MAEESFYDKITKRLAAAKGTMSAVSNDRTMTGAKPNQVYINPDVELRTEQARLRSIAESDTRGAFAFETAHANKLKEHGLMDPGTATAGSSGGNDFHILHSSGNRIQGTAVPSIEEEGKDPEPIKIQGETKKSISSGKMGSVAIRHTPEKGWHIPESTLIAKPEFSRQVHAATVIGKDGKTRSLLDHLNHHWGDGTGATPMVTSETTDLAPAHAYFNDHGVDVVHIGDRGTFRGGGSRANDRYGLGLPSIEGTGRFTVSTERKRTPEQIARGIGMQINFRPHPKSVKPSHIDTFTDEGATALKDNLNKNNNKKATAPTKWAESMNEMKTVTNRSHASKNTIKIGSKEHSFKSYSYGAHHPTFGPLKDKMFKTKSEMKDAMMKHSTYNDSLIEEDEINEVSTKTLKSYLEKKKKTTGKDYTSPSSFRKSIEGPGIAQAKLGKTPKRRILPDVKVMATEESVNEEINETNQWAIATPTKKGGWRRVPDTRFYDQDRAHAYGKKYHTSNIFGPQYKVIPHPDPLKEESINEAVDPSEMHRRHHTLFWGRANPPHAGHEAAYNVVKDTARRSGGTSSMVLTRTHDKKKNPLTPEQKEEHAKASFPDVNTFVTDESHPTILHHLSKLHENGVTDLHLVAGSDRLPDYDRLINQYNGVHGNHGYYNFKTINMHSSGDRDPDAEGVAGISASVMRDHATSGRQPQFEAGAPSNMSAAQRTKMYNDVRAGMASGKKAVKESIEECHLCGRPGCKVHKKKV